MNDLSEVTIGTKLFVRVGHYDRGCIEVVERITPTGRIVTRSGTYERSGYKRGGDSWSRGYARIATEDDIAGIYRYGLVGRLRHFDWNKLSADDLKAVDEITKKYDAK